MKYHLFLLAFLFTSFNVAAESLPPLWGYGQKNCERFVQAWDTQNAQDETSADKITIYRSWLTGFVSGLNLATGEDVLHGENIKATMLRIHVECDGNEDSDFFNAALSVIRQMQRDAIKLTPSTKSQ